MLGRGKPRHRKNGGKKYGLSKRKRKVELSRKKGKKAVQKGDENRAVKKEEKLNYFALSER